MQASPHIAARYLLASRAPLQALPQLQYIVQSYQEVNTRCLYNAVIKHKQIPRGA
jgi:hypothetical protein